MTNAIHDKVNLIHPMMVGNERKQRSIFGHDASHLHLDQSRLGEGIEHFAAKKVANEEEHARPGNVAVGDTKFHKLLLIRHGRHPRSLLGHIRPDVAEKTDEESSKGDASLHLRLFVGESVFVGVISFSNQFTQNGTAVALLLFGNIVILSITTPGRPFGSFLLVKAIIPRFTAALTLEILETLLHRRTRHLLPLRSGHPQLLLDRTLIKYLLVHLDHLRQILIQNIRHRDEARCRHVQIVHVAPRQIRHGPLRIGNPVEKRLVPLLIVQIEQYNLPNVGQITRPRAT
mmetsp:Transcript_35951/g.64770  ORF Transcript_35951/g.64770 Transcript_35951/m.64770 type:complete len:288 (-) Transcript_35951:435-1298(-)